MKDDAKDARKEPELSPAENALEYLECMRLHIPDDCDPHLLRFYERARVWLRAAAQEHKDAMDVLAPNMPEQGLVDACRQVRQACLLFEAGCESLEEEKHELAVQLCEAERCCDAYQERALELWEQVNEMTVDLANAVRVNRKVGAL